MSKTIEKIKAIELRRKGWSIKDIAKALQVSPSSASVWCQEVELSEKQKEILFEKQVAAGNSGRQRGADMNRQKRNVAISVANKDGDDMIGKISNRDLLMLGIGLYWGEGVKSRSSATALVNSDPDIIILGKQWMEKCLGVRSDSFSPYLYINEAHSYRTTEILRFWISKLEIPIEQFHTPFIVKHDNKKQYENPENYYGVLSLRVKKGTNLKYRIKGLIRACSPN